VPVSGPLSGYRLGVPSVSQRQFFAGDGEYAALFERTLAQFAAQGAELVELDFAPFAEAARLLYEGPWIAERFHATRQLLDGAPEAVLPVTRQIIEAGRDLTAEQTFDALYRLR